MECFSDLKADHSTRAACAMIGLSRATLYRHRESGTRQHEGGRHGKSEERAPRRQPAALTPQERAVIVDYATSREFVDKSPHQMYYTLLERGVYLGRPRTLHQGPGTNQ